MKTYTSVSFEIGLLLITFIAFSGTVSAQEDHEPPPGTTCEVAGVTIDCEDAGITDAHDPNCLFLHYHGELEGVSDPEPNGCGHGPVESVAPSTPDSSSTWETVTDWLDVFFQSISGGFSPKTVDDSVDIVVDATPSIKENADNAEEYFDTYEDAPDRDRYTLETENPEENAPSPTIYRWFWSWFE